MLHKLVSLDRFYRDGRATRLGKLFSDFWAAWSAIGLPSYGMVKLELRGRKSGLPMSLAVVRTPYRGADFLVSMLGECEWVRNARAHPEATITKFSRRDVRLEEVAVADRAPIIAEYLRHAPGGRPHIGLDVGASLDECAAVAARHPVFRIVAR